MELQNWVKDEMIKLGYTDAFTVEYIALGAKEFPIPFKNKGDMPQWFIREFFREGEPSGEYEICITDLGTAGLKDIGSVTRWEYLKSKLKKNLIGIQYEVHISTRHEIVVDCTQKDFQTVFPVLVAACDESFESYSLIK
jgi:hypothetical protein